MGPAICHDQFICDSGSNWQVFKKMCIDSDNLLDDLLYSALLVHSD